MPGKSRNRSIASIRRGRAADLNDLVELETQVFASDRMSRRSLRHFLAARSATVLVAPQSAGLGLGPSLLAACEQAARARGRQTLRLEVHENNHRAISRYRKAGYRQFGCHAAYYADEGDALRFEKLLTARK